MSTVILKSNFTGSCKNVCSLEENIILVVHYDYGIKHAKSLDWDKWERNSNGCQNKFIEISLNLGAMSVNPLIFNNLCS